MDGVCNYKELRQALAELADDEYCVFSMKRIPSERPFIGMRIPLMWEIVARVSDEKNFEFLRVELVVV